MTNCELGQSIKNDDETAFAVFYNKHHFWVFRKASNMLNLKEDAEEAAQDVFVKAWKNRKSWKSCEGTFLTWFNTICRNDLIDSLRHQNRMYMSQFYNTSDIDYAEILANIPNMRSENPLDALISEEQIVSIEEGLCNMSSRNHRMSWVLRHIEGYGHKDISRILKSSIGSTKIHINRANQYLKKHLTSTTQ